MGTFPKRGPYVQRSDAIGLLFMIVCLSVAASSASAFVIQPFNDKWGTPGFGNPGGVVTWSLMPTGTPIFAPLESFLPGGFHSQLETAFDAWAAVANISFMEVPDDGAFVSTEPTAGVIRIGGTFDDGPGGVFAFTQQPVGSQSEASNPPGGNIIFDISENWALVDGVGLNFFRVALHEIGHGIGLDHETGQLAVMSPGYTESTPLGLLPDDIAGAQFIYGSVPEPSTIFLLSTALLCLFAIEGLAPLRDIAGELRPRAV